MPTIRTKTVYITDDGNEFYNEEDAIRHEQKQKLQDATAEIAARIRKMFGVISSEDLYDLEDKLYDAEEYEDEDKAKKLRAQFQKEERARAKLFDLLEEADVYYDDSVYDVAHLLSGIYTAFGMKRLKELFTYFDEKVSS